MAKVWVSVRVQEDVATALNKYCEKTGFSDDAIIRIAIKKELRTRGVKI